MHKRKSIRILYVVHPFCGRGRKRVPIDIIKASAFRRQAKRRCLWVGLIIALTAWSTSLRSRFASTKRVHLHKGVGWSALHSFGCTARQARYAEIKNARRRINARTRNQFFKRANKANKMR